MLVRIIAPNRDGLAPKLAAGECCRDSVHGLWHCCTPDGTRFAVHGEAGTKFNYARIGAHGLEIVPGVPSHAAKRSAVVANRWTVKEGAWVLT